MKYHVNPATGKAARCTAKPGNCRFGAQALHFADEASAMVAFELSMEGQTFSAGVKKKVADKFQAAAKKNSNLDPIEYLDYDEAWRRLTDHQQNELANQDTVVRDWYWEARENQLAHESALAFAHDWDELSHTEFTWEEANEAYHNLLHEYRTGTRKPGEHL